MQRRSFLTSLFVAPARAVKAAPVLAKAVAPITVNHERALAGLQNGYYTINQVRAILNPPSYTAVFSGRIGEDGRVLIESFDNLYPNQVSAIRASKTLR